MRYARQVLRECAELARNPPEGVRLAAMDGGDGEDGECDINNIGAWIMGPEETPFAGGFFRVKFAFGMNYPAEPPSTTMVTRIFHPNVSPSTNEICVNALKKDWKPSYGIAHILLVIKCLMIQPNPASALHAEAGRLLLEDYDQYHKHARLMTSIHASKRPVEFGPEPKADKSAEPLGSSSQALNAVAASDTVAGKKRGAAEAVDQEENGTGALQKASKTTPEVKGPAGGAKKKSLKRL